MYFNISGTQVVTSGYVTKFWINMDLGSQQLY